MFPKTLIQIHYHDKPCGVMQVIRYYAKAFKTITRENDSSNILICEKQSEEKYPEFPDRSIKSLPQAGYKEFKNRKDFLNSRKIIIEKIASLLRSEEVQTPAAIISHNLTLCKNAALVSAFTGLARSFSSRRNEYRFFSVAHDFAQEGRVRQLVEINKLEKSGIAIRMDISAAGAPVHFLAVHPRTEKALDRAGFHASLLENPVMKEPISGKGSDADVKKLFIKRLIDHSRKKGIVFKPDRPVFIYPVRTIARKNPFEAIAVACIVNDANLLLGSAGSSAIDKKRHVRIKQLAKKYRLPVITDIRDIVAQSRSLREFARNNPAPLLYVCADKVLTCAVTEGFGYLHYEPWLYDKPVFGRRPTGFDSISKTSGTFFYDFLPVPSEWIHAAVIKKKYEAAVGMCFTKRDQRRIFVLEVANKLNRKFIDFAFLDGESQIGIIKKLLSSEKLRTSWRALLEKPMQGWPGLSAFAKEPERAIIIDNRKRVGKQFSMKKFTREFNRCLRIIPEDTASAVDWHSIEKAYGDPSGFRV